ncbi:3-isopropylmalate dehydratase small subunit [bacterium]|nr:3-isopropylmalate dehydratase small subunit [bacterium]
MPTRGRIFKYGENVNTDVIFPGKYTYTIQDPHEMAKHALEDLDPQFSSTVKEGDIIVAGSNFGCGSSREQAATCIKYAGVSAVVAKSFSRLFFRNAINQGLMLVQCPEIFDNVEKGDVIEIDFDNGKIMKGTKEFSFPPIPLEILEIMKDGGLIPHTKKKLSTKS